MAERQSTYVVTREDRAQDPVTFVAEGLALGRLTDCEVCLNHPTVSRLHAGVREIDGRFYVFHLSPSNSTTLNGQLVEERAALADGDVLQIGPFFLRVRIAGDTLALSVTYQPAVRVGEVDVRAALRREAQLGRSSSAALDLFWEKRKREAGKVGRPSQLRPREPPRLGKTRHNWSPTRDLARPYPLAVFAWSVVAVGLLTAAAAFGYTAAFAPASLSHAHARASLSASPALARRPNANSCTTCHSVSRGMDESCASCHRTESFDPAPADAHAAAGLGCADCHAEHRGPDFRPGVASLSASFQRGVANEETCAGCHADANRKTYDGRAVHTPHGGTFGYPVAGGHWVWKGLSRREWDEKPPDLKGLLATQQAATQRTMTQQMTATQQTTATRQAATRQAATQQVATQQASSGEAARRGVGDDAARSLEFHALHVQRVRAVGGLRGDAEGRLSCSSCHRSLGASLDRATPRTTCAACHDGRADEETGRALVASNAPNCTSCHVEHARSPRRWGAPLLAQH